MKTTNQTPPSVAELRAIIADTDLPIHRRQEAERRLRRLSAESRALRKPFVPENLDIVKEEV